MFSLVIFLLLTLFFMMTGSCWVCVSNWKSLPFNYELFLILSVIKTIIQKQLCVHHKRHTVTVVNILLSLLSDILTICQFLIWIAS
uniref:Secreted peptide n=1 Tax=Rhizophora mucronata TaxID=61149 RepID=A0A2P2NLZ5_RHIMU